MSTKSKYNQYFPWSSSTVSINLIPSGPYPKYCALSYPFISRKSIFSQDTPSYISSSTSPQKGVLLTCLLSRRLMLSDLSPGFRSPGTCVNSVASSVHRPWDSSPLLTEKNIPLLGASFLAPQHRLSLFSSACQRAQAHIGPVVDTPGNAR